MKRKTMKEGSFPSAAIGMSVLLAVVIFFSAGLMMKHQASVKAKLAGIVASAGKYDIARELMTDIDDEHYNEGMYNIALSMMKRDDYDLALECFKGLGEYSDSKRNCILCNQKKAEMLISQGEYYAAADILKEIMTLDGSKALFDECQYNIALEKIGNGDWLVAVRLLWSIRDYRDAETLARKTAAEHSGEADMQKLFSGDGSVDPSVMQDYIVLRDNREPIRNGSVAVGFRHTAGLRKDGTVVACGDNSYGQCETESWENVAQIAAGAYHTVALLRDGTVVACGDNSSGQCRVGKWKNVVQIAASDYNTAALLADGTVVTCGFNNWSQVKGWSDIDSICCGAYSLCGITVNGKMYTTHPSFRLEGELADAGASTAYSIGLTYSGDVIYSSDTPCDWTKAVAVYAGGESVAVIDSEYRPSVYNRRKAVYAELPEGKAVSVSLGGTHFAVLYDDGSVYCDGKNDYGQCETSDWDLN